MDLISGMRAEINRPVRTIAADAFAAFSLADRTAVVTGAASGIGRAAAIAFAKAGAKVVVADVNTEGLDETASMIEGAIVAPTDVADRGAVDDLARQAVMASGRIDVWANVAGIIRNASIVDLTEEDLDAVISVNLKGVVWGTAVAGRVMSAAGRGSIINIASAGGEIPAPTLAAYGMAKAGVMQLTRVAAAELGPAGVRVNSIAPGLIVTNMTSRGGQIDEATLAQMVEGFAAASPLRTTGVPEDIAHMMLYLASDASRYVTGQVMRVNGGSPMG
jgi:3-oxoacyl-[acyl-carrier protein] reductase